MALLFLMSIIMVFCSSFLIASIFDEKKISTGFLYTLLIAFAQVVVSFEILSIFQKISAYGMIFMNILFLIISIIIWTKKGRPLSKINIKRPLIRIKNALIKDKILMAMAVGFVFFICVAAIICIFVSVNSYDALSYHLNRVAFWIDQGSFNHFLIADDRNVVMPINSEILYTWVLVFLKNDWGLSFVSFGGVIVSLYALYNTLGLFGFCERKKLWSVFILSSFASIIAEASSYDTDVVIGGLVLSGIYLYLFAIKNRRLSPIYFSSLAFALAFGTKTPSLIAFPACFLLIAYFSLLWTKKEFYKPLITFCVLLSLNFLIFSSYNYILNFINYGNFLATDSSRIVHSFWGGPKAFIANFVRYVFMIFDFSGFRYSEYLGDYINSAKYLIFAMLHIPPNLGVTITDNNIINNGLMDMKVGAGILGFLIFLPCAIYTPFIAIKKTKCKKLLYLIPFGCIFWINLLVMSGTLGFMVFSIRFITFFMILSSPIIALSYIKKNNIAKLVILFFSLSYFFLISTHLTARSIKDLINVFRSEKTIAAARDKISCSMYRGYDGNMPYCKIRNYLRTLPAGSKIGIFANSDTRTYHMKMLFNEGYTVDFLLLENLITSKLSKYDYLVMTDPSQTSTLIFHQENAYKGYYHVEGTNIVFDKQSPIRCFYVDSNHIPIFGNDKQIPVQSVCFPEENFFEENGFKVKQMFIFRSQLKENNNQVTIYERK